MPMSRRSSCRPDVHLRGQADTQKALEVAIEAIARVPGARLIVVGDGPDRDRLEAVARSSGAPERFDLRGSIPREEALGIVAGSEAALLTSAWENFPHSAVEALAVGVPVVSTAVGGVPEIVRSEVNGLLVPVGDVSGVAAALTRILNEEGLRARLASACRPSVAHLSIEHVYRDLVAILERAARCLTATPGCSSSAGLGIGFHSPSGWRRSGMPSRRSSTTGSSAQPKAPGRFAASGSGFALPPGRACSTARLFYLRLPFRISRQIEEFRPEAIVAADPFIGAAALLGRRLARTRTPLILEVHGDWHTFTRGYGSPSRRFLSPCHRSHQCLALRRADETRALSAFTSGLIEEVRGEPATATFPTYSDLSAFLADPVQPLPERPVAVFVGMLEAYKNIDGLAAAWRRVVASIPEARLVIIGKGKRKHVVDALLRDLPEQVEYHAQLLPAEVAAKLDEATLLVLPSWPEGLGRVVIEAFARGRGVVATGAGGVLDLVTNDVEGILIAAGRHGCARGRAQPRVDRPRLAERLGSAAHERYADWHATAAGFAQQMRDLVDLTLRPTRELTACGSSFSRRSSMRITPRSLRRSTSSRLSRAAARRSPSSAITSVGTTCRERPPLDVRLLVACRPWHRLRARVDRELATAASAARRCARTHDPDLPHACLHRSAGHCAFRSVSGTRTGTPTDRCGSRRSSRTFVFSVDRRSFPLASPKVRGIGHAIDAAPVSASSWAEAASRDRCACSRSAG